MNFVELREKYPNFIYSSYSIQDEGDKIVIGFEFEIENLAKFNPHIEILKKSFNFKPINDKVRNIVFNMGMIEAMSYFKATCSPQFLIKCGSLDDFQKELEETAGRRYAPYMADIFKDQATHEDLVYLLEHSRKDMYKDTYYKLKELLQK